MVRILRLIKILNYIPDLNIILQAFSSSFLYMFYIVLLMWCYFALFAIGAILLFTTNDRANFGTLQDALLTMFMVKCATIVLASKRLVNFFLLNMQVSTLDNWSIVARINMMGCSNYGYSTGLINNTVSIFSLKYVILISQS